LDIKTPKEDEEENDEKWKADIWSFHLL
jgi:hypothetical protein